MVLSSIVVCNQTRVPALSLTVKVPLSEFRTKEKTTIDCPLCQCEFEKECALSAIVHSQLTPLCIARPQRNRSARGALRWHSASRLQEAESVHALLALIC